MLNDGMPMLWIIINLSDFQSTLVLILRDMRYKNNGVNNFAKAFARIIAKINSVAPTRFFKATCCGIFEHLLAIGFKNRGLLGPISTNFGIVEANGWGMLRLHCLIWLCNAFQYLNYVINWSWLWILCLRCYVH